MENLTPIIRKETFLAKAAGQDVETPTPITREEVFLDAIAKGGGKKFIVTLTPTALNYSGTMDKTVAEINAAYEAGQQIVFRVMMSATAYMDVDCTARYFDGSAYPSFNAYIVGGDNDIAISAFTGTSNDGTQQTYSTRIYTLTPAS